MADPVIADHWRAQAIFQGSSNLPEDRFVNTFAFRNDGVGNPAEDIADALRDFYGVAGAPSTATVASFMCGAAMNTAPLEVRVYDLGAPPPREPTILTRAVVRPTGTDCFPAEAALALSYYAGINQPRYRGRIFIGPLTESAGNLVGGAIRPSPVLQNAMLDSAASALSRPDLTWVLISQTDGVARVITDMWVDNAFDTIRKRGPEATSRIEKVL
jgi:hypothetical protein